MSLFNLATLLAKQTKEALFQGAIDVAIALNVAVESWTDGDPTRSMYLHFAEVLANKDDVIGTMVAGAFRDTWVDADQWGPIAAEQIYGVERIQATFASTPVVLTNTDTGYFELEPGDVTVKNTTTGATYHSTTGGILNSGPGTTLTITVVADEEGSAGSALAGEIDDVVTGLLGVECSNAAAAVGVDAEEIPALAERCGDSIGSWSPNGPSDAYAYAAKTPSISGTTNVTRARVLDDSDTGDVIVFIAGPSGSVSGGDVTLVENAIVRNALATGMTPTIQSAVNEVIDVTYTIWIYESVNKTDAEVKAAIAADLLAMMKAQPIGGNVIVPDPGKIHKSLIESTIRATFKPHCFRVLVTTPAGDTTLALDETTADVAVLGTITPTVNFIEEP